MYMYMYVYRYKYKILVPAAIVSSIALPR